MKFKLLLSALIFFIIEHVVLADCTFVYINKSKSPVTLQGYFMENGDAKNPQGWVTIDPTREVTQVRGGTVKCNSLFKHSSELVTRVDLKNGSGYWIGNKGILFAADRCYSHYAKNRAVADDGNEVTLSNEIKVNSKQFRVVICDPSIDKNNCK